MQFFDPKAIGEKPQALWGETSSSLGRNLKLFGEKPQALWGETSRCFKVQIFDYNIFMPFINLQILHNNIFKSRQTKIYTHF